MVPSILTTLCNPPLRHPHRTMLDNHIDVVDRRSMNKAQLLVHLVKAAPRYDAVVLDGSVGLRGAYVDLIAAGLIARRRGGPAVVLADCTWKRGSWWLDRMACRFGIRGVDAKRITYCVLSSDEKSRFPRVWGVDAERVVFTPWCYTLPLEDLDQSGSDDGGVFAGGNSMRDYGPLIEAARSFTDDFTIAADYRPDTEPPSNVRIGTASHRRFVESMRGARMVVVPLQPEAERSAGQQTYLNAMAMGKIVIVTEGPGTRDYIKNGVTGIIVPSGDSQKLSDAIGWIADPGHRDEVDAIRNRARNEALQRFSPANYADSLLNVVQKSLAHTN